MAQPAESRPRRTCDVQSQESGVMQNTQASGHLQDAHLPALLAQAYSREHGFATLYRRARVPPDFASGCSDTDRRCMQAAAHLPHLHSRAQGSSTAPLHRNRSPHEKECKQRCNANMSTVKPNSTLRTLNLSHINPQNEAETYRATALRVPTSTQAKPQPHVNHPWVLRPAQELHQHLNQGRPFVRAQDFGEFLKLMRLVRNRWSREKLAPRLMNSRR